MRRWSLRALGMAFTVLLSCQSGDELALDVEHEETGLDPELLRRMNVRVITEFPIDQLPATGAEPNNVAAAIGESCVEDDQGAGVYQCPSFGCDAYLCQVESHLCAAHQLLRIVENPGEYTFSSPSPMFSPAGDITIPAQDQESNMALAQWAYFEAQAAVVWAGVPLEGTGGCTDLAPTWNGLHSRGVYFATAYGEAFDVATQAIEAQQRAGLAAAEGAFAERAELADAAPYALQIRRLTTEWITGGSALGMPDVGDGMCVVPRRTFDTDAVIALIRRAAPDPAALLADTEIDAFVIDTLADRLAVLRADPVLASTTLADEVYRRLELPRSEFLAAREYLRAELRSFDRSLTHHAPALALPGMQTTEPLFTRYASTASSPLVPLDAYFGAVASFRSREFAASHATPQTVDTGGWDNFNLVPPGGSTASPTPSYASLADGFVTGADRIILRTDTQLGGVTVAGAIRDVLGGLLADADTLRPGRIDACFEEVSSTNFVAQLTVYGRDLAENLEIVSGHAGLQCAVRGTVEGSPCDLADYIPQTGSEAAFSGPFVITTDVNTTSQTGFPSYLTRNIRLDTLAPSTQVANASLLFLVARNPSTSGAPGDWEARGGVMLHHPTPGTTGVRYCLHAPLVPHAQRLVARSLAVSPSFCGMQAESCAGVPWDQRLPLETSLTADALEGESSWRRYLDLAQRASDHADMLGEEVIRAGLDMDLAAGSAIDELQQLCGVSLNVTSLSGLDTLPRVTGLPCDPAAGYRQEGSRCVLDPVLLARSMAGSDADAERLDACLGAGATVPWATVGNLQLCIWQSGPGQYCGGADPTTRPCPYEATSSGTCDPDKTPVPFRPAIPVTTTLGLFHHPDPTELGPNPSRLGEAQNREFPCADIAEARLNGRPLPSSPFLTASHFAEVAHRLSWSAGVGDYSSVLWDNGRLFSTGSVGAGPSNGWPCEPPPACGDATDQSTCESLGCSWSAVTVTCEGTVVDPLCPGLFYASGPAPSEHAGSLFCLRNVCGSSDPYAAADRLRRARVNDLLARAVIAARLLGGRSLQGIRVPYYPRSREALVRIGAPPGWNVGTSITGMSGSYLYQRSMSGSLDVYDSDFGPYNHVTIPFGDMDLIGERISGTVDAAPDDPLPAYLRSIEWSACPYDWFVGGTDNGWCIELFDDARDLDDPSATELTEEDRRTFDRDLPFFTRALGEGTDGNDPGTAVTRLWEGVDFARVRESPVEQRSRLVVPARDALFREDEGADLTGYWLRSSCGNIGGAVCQGFGGRDADEEELVREDQAVCATNDAVVDGCDTIGCLGNRYFECRASADAHGLEFDATFDANRAFIAPRGLTGADFLNGIELLCVAEQRASPDANFGCPPGPPAVNSVADMYELEAFMRCKAARIRASAASAIVRDLPTRVVDLVRQRGAGGVYGDATGEYAAATSELAAAYIEFRDSEEEIASTMDDLADQIDLVRNAIAQSGVAHQIEDLQLGSTIATQLTACTVAVADALSHSFDLGKWAAGAGEVMAMAATCINSGVQIGLATAISDLRHEGIELQNEAAFIQFELQFNALSRSLSRQSTTIQSSMLRISAAQGRLATLRERGRRAVARALFLTSDTTGQQFAANTVMRARYNTALHRYREAHQSSVRLAYIAKLALEQRLGMTLDSMTDDLLTVEAPARWHSRICTMPSIDYDRVRSVMSEDGGAPVEPPDGYAGAYVGDYVRRLEQVFESYNFAYPFADGADTAVISLRDDIHGIRSGCPVEVPNLLYHSANLGARATETRPGWSLEGCGVVAADAPPPGEPAYGDPPPGCVVATETGPQVVAPSVAPGVGPFGAVTAQLVEFGTPAGTHPVVDALTPASRLTQRVDLPIGRYRVSWYGRVATVDSTGATVAPTAQIDPSQAVRVISPQGADYYASPFGLYLFSSTDGIAPMSGWTRYWYFFDASRSGEHVVTIDPRYPSSPAYRAVEIAGLMLEDVSETVVDAPSNSVLVDGMSVYLGSLRGPPPFFETEGDRTRWLPMCPDTDGSTFRRYAWTYGCVTVCPDGYDGDCDDSAQERCFYQTVFSVSSDSLQSLAGGTTAGFAAGNFNYRVHSVGVNLVGTGLRDCEGLGRGFDGCYASGNLAYSILHDGPYLVRNARGDLYEAPLFRGRIESARALAAERYLGNPLSTTDRGLIEPYVRYEMQGRPLGGTFVLRVWDDGGLRFERLEDVQLVLNYGYWTRQR